MPAENHFRLFTRRNKIYSWISKEMSEKSLENIATADDSFAPTCISTCPLPFTSFNGHCLMNKLIDSVKSNKDSVYFLLEPWSRELNTDFILHNFSVGSVDLTKNTNPDKSKYSGYDIGFDSRSEFSFTD